MKKVIWLVISCIPFINNAQEKGIRWTEGLTWEQVKEKAKIEKKYIFIDCYTTWCGPCKAMDKNVYTDEKVGRVTEDKFISVKVQMDKTAYDDESVKQWYQDAALIQANYTVDAFPTFLFVYPDGKPMHKAVGYKNPDQFVSLIREALDTKKQYYTILSDFKPGKMDTGQLKRLAREYSFSEKELSWKLAEDFLRRVPQEKLGIPDNIDLMIEFSKSPQVQDIAMKYLSTLNNAVLMHPDNLRLLSNLKKHPKVKGIISNYFDTLSKNVLFTRLNLELLKTFTSNSKDWGFKIFYDNAPMVDKAMGLKGNAQAIIDNIIIEEEFRPSFLAVKDGKAEPDWRKMYDAVKKRYNTEYADRNLLVSQVRFYEYRAKKHNRNWSEYIKYSIELYDTYVTDTSNLLRDVAINNFCYEAILFHSSDKRELMKAINWLEEIMKKNNYSYSSQIDTYANLLYKAVRKDEAIQWEEKALKIALEDKNEYAAKIYQGVISDMKRGKPIWLK